VEMNRAKVVKSESKPYFLYARGDEPLRTRADCVL
jgi:hypothetical protein